MSGDVFYFTGTGNSLHIARRVARATGGRIRSIPRVLSRLPDEEITASIVIVFPAYLSLFYGIPVVVKEFVERIPDLSTKEVVAICSCGGYEIVNAVPSVGQLAKIIRARGGRLSRCYTVRMPMNNLDYDHIPVPIERDTKVIFAKAEEKLAAMAEALQKRKRTAVRNVLADAFQVLIRLSHSWIKKMSYGPILEAAGEPPDSRKPIEEVFRLTDRSISAGTRCTGCGICAEVCPVSNIRIIEKRPVWLHRCEMCFACHEWCPQKTIRHWGRRDGVYCHHPEVELRDMMGQQAQV